MRRYLQRPTRVFKQYSPTRSDFSGFFEGLRDFGAGTNPLETLWTYTVPPYRWASLDVITAQINNTAGVVVNGKIMILCNIGTKRPFAGGSEIIRLEMGVGETRTEIRTDLTGLGFLVEGENISARATSENTAAGSNVTINCSLKYREYDVEEA